MDTFGDELTLMSPDRSREGLGRRVRVTINPEAPTLSAAAQQVSPGPCGPSVSWHLVPTCPTQVAEVTKGSGGVVPGSASNSP